jgi:hypothetical protein
MYEYANKSNGYYAILLISVLFLGTVSLLLAQETAAPLDRTDPEAVAKYILTAIKENDLDAILEVMDKDQKKDFLPFDAQNRQALELIVIKDLEKIGKRAKISELRKCTTLSGKPGVVARAGRKGDEVHVIILSQEGDIYSYENILTLLNKAYKELTFIKKVK